MDFDVDKVLRRELVNVYGVYLYKRNYYYTPDEAISTLFLKATSVLNNTSRAN